jgi:hypothetical protein
VVGEPSGSPTEIGEGRRRPAAPAYDRLALAAQRAADLAKRRYPRPCQRRPRSARFTGLRVTGSPFYILFRGSVLSTCKIRPRTPYRRRAGAKPELGSGGAWLQVTIVSLDADARRTLTDDGRGPARAATQRWPFCASAVRPTAGRPSCWHPPRATRVRRRERSSRPTGRTRSRAEAASRARSGAAPESNRPSVGLPRRTSFEDSLGHRARAAPRAP